MKNTEYKDRDFLYDEYIIKRKTVKEIAKKLNVSGPCIREWLHKFDIPLFPHYEHYRVNLIGRKFGRLVVIKECEKNQSANTTASGIKWLCKCDCGNEIVLTSRLLLHKHKSSCGKHTKKGYQEISGTFFQKIKRNAIDRNLDFLLTLPELWELFLKQNRKCALSGVELNIGNASYNSRDITASLDRIDCSKGYIKGNVQWLHKDINRCKWIFTEKEFLEWVKKIYDCRISNA